MLAGASRFNAKPKEGIQFFVENGLIPQIKGEDGASKAQSLARFLKKCPRLDKKLLGDFLSRPDNRGVLDAFIRLFDFKEVRFVHDISILLLNVCRKPLLKPCETSLRRSVCQGSLSKSSALQRPLRSAILPLNPVSPVLGRIIKLREVSLQRVSNPRTQFLFWRTLSSCSTPTCTARKSGCVVSSSMF
jgi:Sec7 domain